MVCKERVSVLEDNGGGGKMYIISKPIILQRIDILLGHCIPSAPSHYSTSPPGWNTYAVRRNLYPTISFSSSQTPIQPREYSQLRYASSGASFILLVSHFPSISPLPLLRTSAGQQERPTESPKCLLTLPLKGWNPPSRPIVVLSSIPLFSRCRSILQPADPGRANGGVDV
jgi:hypothetical protein